MKKIILGFFVLLSISSFSLADVLSTNVEIPNVANFDDLGLKFCDKGYDNLTDKALINIRPGQTKEMCLVFFNKTNSGSISVNAGIVSARIDKNNKYLCSPNMNTGEFADLFDFDQNDLNFVLPPLGKVIKKLKFSAAKDMSGSMYGCVSYQPEQKRPDNYKGIFFVVRRKSGIVNINITGDVYNLAWLDDVKYLYKDNQDLILKIIIAVLSIMLTSSIVSTIKKSKVTKKHKK